MICQVCQNNRKNSIIFSNNCERHRQQYSSVSLSFLDQTKTYKACKKCEEEKKENRNFYNFKDIKEKLNTSASVERINQVIQISQQIIKQTEKVKEKLIRMAEEITEVVLRGIYNLYQFQATNEAECKNTFSDKEFFYLLTPSTIKTLEDLKNNQISIQISDDMSSMLLTKILFMEKFDDFIKDINKNSQEMQNDMEQRIQKLQQTKEQIESQIQVQPNQLENFKNKSIIKKFEGKKQQISQEEGEYLMVKAIMRIDKDQLAYAMKNYICILNNNLEKIDQLDLEDESIISFACSFQDMGQKYIAAGIDNNICQIQMWKANGQKWGRFQSIEVDQSVIKIIHSSQNNIISCCEDMKVEIINFVQQGQKKNLILEEQEEIKDISLINPSTLIYITNSDIKAYDFNAKNYLDKSQNNDRYLCLELMNSERFVIGNSEGKVLICSFKNKIQINQVLQLHKKDVRYICKIDQKQFITSSFDGEHSFATLDGAILKTIKDGPQQDFPDPLFWDSDLNCLIASSGGQVYKYQ